MVHWWTNCRNLVLIKHLNQTKAHQQQNDRTGLVSPSCPAKTDGAAMERAVAREEAVADPQGPLLTPSLSR